MRARDIDPPKPLPSNLSDAIEHADTYGEGWTLNDFDLKYEGYLTVQELWQFDDLSGWLETDEPDDLIGFRNGSFAGEPSRDMPPIIIITAKDHDFDGLEVGCHTQIGDGRGRVNFANAHGLRLHVWHLILKSCID